MKKIFYEWRIYVNWNEKTEICDVYLWRVWIMYYDTCKKYPFYNRIIAKKHKWILYPPNRNHLIDLFTVHFKCQYTCIYYVEKPVAYRSIMITFRESIRDMTECEGALCKWTNVMRGNVTGDNVLPSILWRYFIAIE